MKRELDETLLQLSRTQVHAERLAGFHDLTAILIDSTHEETERLHAVRDRILAAATVIDLDARVLTAGAALQAERALGPQDALVLASVYSHLGARDTPSCFVTKNTRDFADPIIIDALAALNCKLFARFDACVKYTRAQISSIPGDEP